MNISSIGERECDFNRTLRRGWDNGQAAVPMRPERDARWRTDATANLRPAPAQNCSRELKIQPVKIGGEGGIRTHVPELPDHPISSRRRYDHFGTSPAEQFRADLVC